MLQPERLHLRWQVRSIGRIIQKLIHIGNTKTIKFYGTRLFLIWYQILNINKTHVEELMFQKLIQGFDTFHSSTTATTSMGIDLLNAEDAGEDSAVKIKLLVKKFKNIKINCYKFDCFQFSLDWHD